MAIRLFFKSGSRIVQLPVNPPSLSIACEGDNEELSIVALGQINLLKSPKLKTASIECFFPSRKSRNNPYVVTSGRFKDANFYVEFFENIRKNKRSVRFIVTGTKINMLVSVENFTYTLNAGDDDISYSLELKQYRPYAAKVVVIQTPPPATAEQTPPTATVEPQREPAGFAVGNEVTVNGNFWYTSQGANPHGTFNNFRGKISIIVADASRPYRYHITTLSGGARGWVSESQLAH